MGQDFSMYRQQPPTGSQVTVIESDDCCACGPCGGRTFDVHSRKPDFVLMSDGAWHDFTTTMAGHVKRYRGEARTTFVLIFSIIFALVVFHPTLGFVGRSMTFGRRLGFAREVDVLEATAHLPEFFWPGDDVALNPAYSAHRRDLQTSGAKGVKAIDSEYEKTGVYPQTTVAPKTWEHYGKACSAGCYYADRAFPLPGAALESYLRQAAEGGGEAGSGAFNDTCGGFCVPAGCTHYVPMHYERALRESSRRCSDAAADTCAVCRHDPCLAMVQLGGGEHGPREWFSCCAAWSYEECSASDREQIGKIKCTAETNGVDGCGGRGDGGGGEYNVRDEDKGFTGGGLGLAMALFFACIAGGVGCHMAYLCSGITHNQQVDREIDAFLATVSGPQSGASFTLLRAFTQACKPKGARTYRALCVAPLGAHMGAPGAQWGGGGVQMGQVAPHTCGGHVSTGVPVMATGVVAAPSMQQMSVQVPVGVVGGQTIAIAGPSGQQYHIVVPAGLSGGDTFTAQIPGAPQPVMATATAVLA